MFGRTNFEDSVQKDTFHDSTINNMINKNGTNTADDYFDFDFHLGQHQFFLFTDTYIKNPFMMIGQNRKYHLRFSNIFWSFVWRSNKIEKTNFEI